MRPARVGLSLEHCSSKLKRFLLHSPLKHCILTHRLAKVTKLVFRQTRPRSQIANHIIHIKMLWILPNHVPKRTFRNCQFIAYFLHAVVILHQRLAFLQQFLMIHDLGFSQRFVDSQSGIRRSLLDQSRQMLSRTIPHAFCRDRGRAQRLGNLQKAFVAAEKQRIIRRVPQRLRNGEEIGVFSANQLRIGVRGRGGDAAQRLAADAVLVVRVCE